MITEQDQLQVQRVVSREGDRKVNILVDPSIGAVKDRPGFMKHAWKPTYKPLYLRSIKLFTEFMRSERKNAHKPKIVKATRADHVLTVIGVIVIVAFYLLSVRDFSNAIMIFFGYQSYDQEKLVMLWWVIPYALIKCIVIMSIPLILITIKDVIGSIVYRRLIDGHRKVWDELDGQYTIVGTNDRGETNHES